MILLLYVRAKQYINCRHLQLSAFLIVVLTTLYQYLTNISDILEDIDSRYIKLVIPYDGKFLKFLFILDAATTLICRANINTDTELLYPKKYEDNDGCAK